MIISRLHKIILFFCLIALTVSCEEDIDLELSGTTPRLVVEARITDELKRHIVKLTKTTSYLGTEVVPQVSGAIINITDDAGEVFQLIETAPGVYKTDSVAGQAGRNYTLNIELNGEKYTASTFMPPVTILDSITYEWVEDHDHYHILMNTQEPQGIGNYYEWLIYRNEELSNDSLHELEYAEDRLVDGNYIANVDIYSFGELEKNDLIRVKQLSLTKEAFEFYYAVEQQVIYKGTPFDSPSANLPSNLSNGALGFFMASAVSEAALIVQ